MVAEKLTNTSHVKANWMLEREKSSELHTPAVNMRMSCVFLLLGFVLIMMFFSDARRKFAFFYTFVMHLYNMDIYLN